MNQKCKGTHIRKEGGEREHICFTLAHTRTPFLVQVHPNKQCVIAMNDEQCHISFDVRTTAEGIAEILNKSH